MLYCKNCNKEMSLLSVAENVSENYAYNIYQCDHCNTLCKRDYWSNFGFTWLMTTGEVVVEREE